MFPFFPFFRLSPLTCYVPPPQLCCFCFLLVALLCFSFTFAHIFFSTLFFLFLVFFSRKLENANITTIHKICVSVCEWCHVA